MISFGELLLIALVSLLVIGPRRLPETVRFVALQAGRLRQALTETRKMVEDELGMDEIRRQLHNEQIMRNLNATREEIERAARGLPATANREPRETAATAEEPRATMARDAGDGSEFISTGTAASRQPADDHLPPPDAGKP